MPTPLLVFSPGFTIHMFLFYFIFYALSTFILFSEIFIYILVLCL